MDISALDTFLAAPLAPLAGAILFWSIQILMAEGLKTLLREIWDNHRAFCRFSNFVALLFQAVSHMLGYTLTGIGVGEFSLSIGNARVTPKREKRGFPSILANVFLLFGPFFIPPLILFLILLPFTPGMEIMECYTFSTALISFGSLLQQYGMNFLTIIVNLDLFNPFHLMFLVAVILIGLGIRPSFIEDEERKYRMIDDLAKIRDFFISHPKSILIFFVSIYILFYILYFLKLPYYVLIFSFFGWLSLISIVSLLIASLFVFLVMVSDRLPSFKKYLPLIVFVLSYISLRVTFTFVRTDMDLAITNIVSSSLTFVSSTIALKMEMDRQKLREGLQSLREVKEKKIDKEDKEEGKKILKETENQ